MKIVINGKTYKKVKALSFAPESDLTGDSIPINEFQADIYTRDNIAIGQYAELYDDLDNIWAKYWICYAEHMTEHSLRIQAQSQVSILSQARLPASVWDGKLASEAIAEAMGAIPYTLDCSFDSATLTGFVPQQESRARLQWICYAIGAYIKTYFNSCIEILPLDASATLIPMSDTFWKPSVTYNDYVTAITAKVYSFAEGTPTTTDKWVQDDEGTSYIITVQDFTLRNADAPEAAPEKTINIEEMYLLNTMNISAVLGHIAGLYFSRAEVDASIINNGQYMPGDKIQVYTDSSDVLTGYMQSASFKFGVQARSDLKMKLYEVAKTQSLTIIYKYNQLQLNKETYDFAAGYVYSIRNPYFNQLFGSHRFVYRPLQPTATGTIVAGENTNTQYYEIALDFYNNELHIISVDEITEETDSQGNVILVIA